METPRHIGILTSCNMCDLMKEDDTIGKFDSSIIGNTKDLNDFDSGMDKSASLKRNFDEYITG